MIKAVVFDLDGTLIDSTDAIVASFFHAFHAVGLTPPARADIVAGIGSPLEDQMRRRAAPKAAACVAAYRAHYAAIACDKTVLLPGAEPMLDALAAAGLELGFATSKKLDAALLVLEHLGVLHHFDARLGPDEVNHPKPAPDAVFKAAELLGVATEELVFVGDMHFDILAAQRAGAPCVAVTTGYEPREELEALGPDAVFDHLGDVAQWVLSRLDDFTVVAEA